MKIGSNIYYSPDNDANY